MTSATPSPSVPPPTTCHSAALFLMQEVVLTFILGMKGNDRNSQYPYPSPLPSHYHLSDTLSHVGFHTVGYRRLGRLLLSTGALSDDDGVGWPACADLAANWMFWLALEYLPPDSELISTPSLPCTLNREQWQAQVEAELSEEQQQIQVIMEQQQPTPPVSQLHKSSPSGPPHTPPPPHPSPPSSACRLLSGLSVHPFNLRVNTEDSSPALWAGRTGGRSLSCPSSSVWWTSIGLVISAPGMVYHPLALRIIGRLLPFISPHMQRRLLTLLLILSRSNASNAMALGQADVLAPHHLPSSALCCSTPQTSAIPNCWTCSSSCSPSLPALPPSTLLFESFEQPGRFPSSLLCFLSDLAARSVPMPYVLLDGKEAVPV